MNANTAIDPNPLPTRVSYHTGMLLDESDFTAEQNYHRQRLADVLARLHGSGTVAGLKVEGVAKGAPLPSGQNAAEDTLAVHPGLAVDRVGRLIEVPSARCLRLDQWLPGIAAAGANVLKPLELGGKRWLVADVFLRYLECRNGLQPGFPTTGVDATDAIVAARITDEFELVLAPRSSESAGQPPPLPKRPFQPAPANRRALLDALYARYDAPAELLEYPVAPNDNTPAGTPAKKLAEKTAVFLSRVLIRLTDPPASNLVRHGSNEFTIEDEARLALPATELFLSLTPLA